MHGGTLAGESTRPRDRHPARTMTDNTMSQARQETAVDEGLAVAANCQAEADGCQTSRTSRL